MYQMLRRILEVVAWRYSVEKSFRKISQNLWESTCGGISFLNKLQIGATQLCLKDTLAQQNMERG